MAKSKNNDNRKIIYIVDAVIFVVLLSADLFTKYLSIRYLKGKPSISLISGYVELHYLENTGASFGLLKGQHSFFIFVISIVLFALLYVIIKLPGKKKFIPANISMTLIFTGAFGNLIDRLVNKAVTDFIFINFIKFPIFNIADIYITLGCFLVLIFSLFKYKEDDLNFLRFKEKRLREIKK